MSGDTGMWSLSMCLTELKETDPPTSIGTIEIRLIEKLQRLEQSSAGIATIAKEVVVDERSMLFSHNLNFFLAPIFLERSVSDALSAGKLRSGVREVLKDEICDFARAAARFTVSGGGRRPFGVVAEIEAVSIELDGDGEEGDGGR